VNYAIGSFNINKNKLKRGGPFIGVAQHEPVVVEREIVIKGLKIHLKSVFKEQTTLEKALENIIKRKMSAAPENLPA